MIRYLFLLALFCASSLAQSGTAWCTNAAQLASLNPNGLERAFILNTNGSGVYIYNATSTAATNNNAPPSVIKPNLFNGRWIGLAMVAGVQGGGDMHAANNLSDVSNIPAARSNLGAEKKRVFNITDSPYNAVSGGGDVQSAISAAATDAAAVGGIVWIPEGTFNLSSLTLSKSLVTLDGVGTLKATGATAGMTNWITWTGDSNKIRGVKFDGDGKVIHLFNVGSYSKHWRIEKAEFSNARITDANDSGNTVLNSGQRAAAFRLNNGNQDFEFLNSKFYNFSYDGDKVSYLGGAGRCAAAIHAAPFPTATNQTEAILNVRVVNCDFVNPTMGVFKFDEDALVFQNQDYDLVPRSGIYVSGCTFINWCWRDGKMQLSGGTWTDNWQFSPTTAPVSTGPTKRAGIEWFGHNWTVSNVHIYGGSIEHPINAFSYFTQITNSVISNPEVELSATGGTGSYGIWLKSPRGFTLSGGTIRNCGYGIRIEGYARNGTVTGAIVDGSINGLLLITENDSTDPFYNKSADTINLVANIYDNCSNYGEWVSAGTNINQIGANGHGTVALANRASGVTGEVGFVPGLPRTAITTVSPFEVDSTTGSRKLQALVANSSTDTIVLQDQSSNKFLRWDDIALRLQLGNTGGRNTMLGVTRITRRETTESALTASGGAITIDFSSGSEKLTHTQSGALTINAANYSQWVQLAFELVGDGSAITWPAGWKAIGTPLPSSVTSGKICRVYLDCTSTTAASVRAYVWIEDKVPATLTGAETLANKTLTTPAISDFSNANHNHQSTAGGGTLDAAALASGTIAAARQPALTGDVTTLAGSVATTIAANAVTSTKIADGNVTLAKVANIANATVLGNSSGGSAPPSALSTLPNGVQDNITRLGSVNSGTIDGSTGLTLKFASEIQLTRPDQVDNTGATRVATEGATYGQATFSNSADQAGNYVIWRIRVPDDLDTAVDWQAKWTFRLGGADTAKHAYVISMADVADSASADAPTFINAVNLFFTGDASGASGDDETVGWTTLTSWRSSMTAGHILVIKLARDGDDGTNDTSTVNSTSLLLSLKYGVSQ